MRTSPENVNSRFCGYFSTISSRSAGKLCNNSSGIKLVRVVWRKKKERKKMKICHVELTSSTQRENRSFYVVERARTATKCTRMKNARAKSAKPLFSVIKYANSERSCRRCHRGCLSSLSFHLRVRLIWKSSLSSDCTFSDCQWLDRK